MVSRNFPRGGKKPSKKNVTNYLFHRTSNPKPNADGFGGERVELNTEIVARTAQCLTYTTLSQGMTLLGRVHNSTQYDVTISLPGRLSGFLPVTNISEAYTNLLQNIVSSKAHPADFRPLSELYKRGDYVVCCVKTINTQSKHRVILSVEPEMINQNLDVGKLRQGSKIACSVSSVEDHGYAVHTGVQNLRGFLETNYVKDGVKYYPGQQIFCAVRSATTAESITTVKLSTKPTHLNAPSLSKAQHVDTLIPGTKFLLTIGKILPDGLQVTFNTDNIGYINRLYLQKPLDTYEQGSELHATFLYTLPIVKFSYFTEMPLEPELEIVKCGEIEKARVIFQDARGIVLRLEKNIRGFLPFKRTGVDFQRISEKFTPNSTHTCRILTYDNFDRVYVCSTLKHELTSENKIPETVTLGDVMEVKIIRQNRENKFLFVKSGRILGDVAPEQIHDIDDAVVPLISEKLLARVLSRDKKGERFNFTLKKSLVYSHLPILSEFAEAQVGSTYLATIIRKSGQGLLVKFYGDLKGVIPVKSLQNIRGGIKAFRQGQVVHVKVANIIVQEHRLILELCAEDEEWKISPFEIGATVEGKVMDSSVEGVHVRIPHPSGKGTITAYLPAGHMSPCQEMGKRMAVLSVPGDTISARVFSTTPEFVLTKTLIPQEWYIDIKNLSIGDCIPCSITQIHTTGIKVLLPVKNLKCYGIVALNKIDHITMLFKHQILFGKITQINKKTQVIHLTTSLHEVWSSAVENDTDVITSVDVLALYLSKLKELSLQSYYNTKTISKMKLGQKVSGVVEKISENGVIIKLNNGIPATVRKGHFKKSLKVGDEVNGSVLWMNYIDELVEITLNPIWIHAIKPKQNKILEDGFRKRLKGEIVLVDKWFVLAVVKGCGKGSLVALPTKAHVNDLTPDLSNYRIGATIKCYVILKDDESEIVPIVYRETAFVTTKQLNDKKMNSAVKIEDITKPNDQGSESQTLKRNREADDVLDETRQSKVTKKLEDTLMPKFFDYKSEETKQKRKPQHSQSQDEELEVIVPKEEEQHRAKLICASSNESEAMGKVAVIREAIEDSGLKIQNKKYAEVEELSIPECGFFWDSKPDTALCLKKESSGDERAFEELPTRKKRKISAMERREFERQKETEIREKEEELASNQVPNSVEQFNRLILASPDSSFVWLQYMAYHLQSTEIEKARAVAAQALKTINFRQENEKLNIWQGWLNLESRFGTPETLNKIFLEAIKANDSQKIYLHMLKIHSDAGRTAEIERTVKTITGKFKSLPEVWVQCGAVLLKSGLTEKSRQTMQRALQSLPAADHVYLTVKFAQLENKFGDNERAETLFEKILSSYPKRVDVWSIYVDVLIKSKRYDSARRILEHAVNQILPPKKMKALFEKYVTFEEQYGTTETLSHTRKLARKYVENYGSGGNLEFNH
ncbi:protein RRP5 homolog [Diachasma alloeum]|uniref:protein RRP5 homolog n=1 Tax=Diachasma alloeum TaxID=454923 RepID=UPI0007381465|nr:protein RRP5 homolog [Diachasma alloeum]XP_015118085.1 protein RRP5 homolog [Diachasma alloeum]